MLIFIILLVKTNDRGPKRITEETIKDDLDGWINLEFGGNWSPWGQRDVARSSSSSQSSGANFRVQLLVGIFHPSIRSMSHRATRRQWPTSNQYPGGLFISDMFTNKNVTWNRFQRNWKYLHFSKRWRKLTMFSSSASSITSGFQLNNNSSHVTVL